MKKVIEVSCKTVLVISFILLILNSNKLAKNIDKKRHFSRFEKCMIENSFEYSDANCEYCWKLTKN